MTTKVNIVEVGPRDGLQNESKILSPHQRVRLIESLLNAGLEHIEVGSFVSPKAVPQMDKTEEVVAGLTLRPPLLFSALALNEFGSKRALSTEIGEVGIVVAPSETFSQKNLGCSQDESIRRAELVAARAKESNRKVRGYVSCCYCCPFEGFMDSEKVVGLTEQLIALGCDEISLGETLGNAPPPAIEQLCKRVLATVPQEKLALHLHDTYGMALASLQLALRVGVTTFDSSIAGLGGCPFAPGASGNIATEDVVYFFDSIGVETGLDLEKLLAASKLASSLLGTTPRSKVAQALTRVADPLTKV